MTSIYQTVCDGKHSLGIAAYKYNVGQMGLVSDPKSPFQKDSQRLRFTHNVGCQVKDVFCFLLEEGDRYRFVERSVSP